MTLGLMVAADVFLNKKHAATIHTVLPKALQFCGSSLGITRPELCAASPKLASQINEYMGSTEGGSRRRKTSTGTGTGTEQGPDEPDSKPEPKRRVRQKQADPKEGKDAKENKKRKAKD